MSKLEFFILLEIKPGPVLEAVANIFVEKVTLCLQGVVVMNFSDFCVFFKYLPILHQKVVLTFFKLSVVGVVPSKFTKVFVELYPLTEHHEFYSFSPFLSNCFA